MRVAVMRQKRTTGEATARIFVLIGATFLVAWLLMLIAGAVTTWDPSYWHTLLALLGLRMVQTGSGWMEWTHSWSGDLK